MWCHLEKDLLTGVLQVGKGTLGGRWRRWNGLTGGLRAFSLKTRRKGHGVQSLEHGLRGHEAPDPRMIDATEVMRSFKNASGDEFSAYDEKGLPTHYKDGTEVKKSAVKKLEKAGTGIHMVYCRLF